MKSLLFSLFTLLCFASFGQNKIRVQNDCDKHIPSNQLTDTLESKREDLCVFTSSPFYAKIKFKLKGEGIYLCLSVPRNDRDWNFRNSELLVDGKSYHMRNHLYSGTFQGFRNGKSAPFIELQIQITEADLQAFTTCKNVSIELAQGKSLAKTQKLTKKKAAHFRELSTCFLSNIP